MRKPCVILSLTVLLALNVSAFGSMVSSEEHVEKGRLFLTFDDAIDVNCRYALPILQEYGYPAIAFYSTKWVLAFDDFNKYVAAGWEIGCHTYSHPHLNTLSKERLYQEIVQSKFDLEAKIPNINKIVTFAYPYGEGWNNNTVLALVNEHYEKTRPLFENWYQERTFDVGYPEVALTNAQKAVDFVMAGNDAWLMFHAVSDTPTIYFTINTSTFRQVLNIIRIRGIQPTTWTRLHKTTNVVTIILKPFDLSLNYEFADQYNWTAPSRVSIWNKEWEDNGSTDRTRTFNANSTIAIIYDSINLSALVPRNRSIDGFTDLNSDGKVNIFDITVMARAYNTRPGDEKWNAAADLDKNGTVNILDVTKAMLKT